MNSRPSNAQQKQHEVMIVGRKKMEITGVIHVESFDSDEFLVETVAGFLSVQGENLHIKTLSLDQGLLAIEGLCREVRYLDQHGEKAKGLFGRLFK
ncbi:sporulation protein YabP [Rubeoparvulum massiliense]|uniref:sporulation protein YabP n=1 Tax=Rubeoparvulum massiliense TaxID=1631346 RepID=UPI00065E189C|nr:sporulation protein YabP [Rubeoparvulum massiliense]